MSIIDRLTCLVEFSLFITFRLPVRFFFGIRPDPRLDEFTKNQRIIIALNHQSKWDSVLMCAVFPPKVFKRLLPIHTIMADKYLPYWWLKKASVLLGLFPHFSTRKGAVRSLFFMSSMLEKGHTLLIFPEGKMVSKDEESQAEIGVAYLAHRYDCVVIPISISGVRDMNFSKILARRYKVEIVVGKPRKYTGHKSGMKNTANEILSEIRKSKK